MRTVIIKHLIEKKRKKRRLKVLGEKLTSKINQSIKQDNKISFIRIADILNKLTVHKLIKSNFKKEHKE